MGAYIKRHFWVLAFMCCLLAGVARAQSPSPSSSPSLSASASPQPSAEDTESPSPAASTPVRFNSRVLFYLANSGGLTSWQRAHALETRLQEVLQRTPDGEPPAVEVTIVHDTLTLSSEGVSLITVSNEDAQAAGLSDAELGSRWQDALQSALTEAVRDRTAAVQHDGLLWSLAAILLGLVMHPIIQYSVERWLRVPGWSLNGVWWLVILTYCLGQFPRTTEVGMSLQGNLVRPILLLVLVVGGSLAVLSFGTAVVSRYFGALEAVRLRPPSGSAHAVETRDGSHAAEDRLLGRKTADDFHQRHRLQMVRVTLLAVLRTVIITGGILIYLSVLHVNLTALATGAGLVGIAAGVASQDFLKDLMAGLNIILEDQFGVGDVIQSGEQKGEVESFTLRATVIRDAEGTQVTIPNGVLRIVRNLTTANWRWLEMVFEVADGDRLSPSMALLRKLAGIQQDDGTQRVVGSPIFEMSESRKGVYTVRVRFKTRPEALSAVRQEFLDHLTPAFEAAKLDAPTPIPLA